jgi:uncharacterized protein (UPF0332 family)
MDGAYERKAAQSWAGAQAELEAGRYDNAVALAYYACFQRALTAMERAAIGYDRREGYSHGLVLETIGRWMEEANVDQIGSMRTLYDRRLTAQYRSAGLTASVARDAIALAGRILTFVTAKMVTDERDEDGDNDQTPT